MRLFRIGLYQRYVVVRAVAVLFSTRWGREVWCMRGRDLGWVWGWGGMCGCVGGLIAGHGGGAVWA